MSEAFLLLVDYCERQEAVPLNQWPGCWESQIDERWHVSINGHREAMRDSLGGDVPPFSAAIQFNGWPAGIINPYGGVIAAGELANEDTLIDALKATGATLPKEAISA